MYGSRLIMTTMFSQHDRNRKSLPVLVSYEELTPIIEIPASLLVYQVDLIGDIQLSFWNGLAHFGHRVGFVTRLLSQAWPQFPQIQVLSGRDSRTFCLIF